MYALRPSNGTFLIAPKNYRFGKYAFILTYPSEFLNRLSKKVKNDFIQKEYKNPEANLVKYVNSNYSGNLGIFKKLYDFEYQSEWRFVIYSGDGNPKQVRIGSLKDISLVLPAEDLNNRIRIEKTGKICIL